MYTVEAWNLSKSKNTGDVEGLLKCREMKMGLKIWNPRLLSKRCYAKFVTDREDEK